MCTTFRSRFAACFPRQFVLLALLAGTAACGASSRIPVSRELVFDGQNYRVVSLDLKHDPLSLHWRDPDSGDAFGDVETLQQWGESRGQHLLFAANAGIYDRQSKPLGLYVEDGKTLVPLNMAHGNPASGNFSLLPNGVFAIYPDGHAAVRTSAAFKADGKPVRWATQSGPMLVIDGQLNPNFVDDSGSLKWRSGVCAKSPTEVVFAVSEVPVNFHGFARLFRDKLGCRDALYLDGSISQIFVEGEGYAGAPAFLVKPYAGIFAVFVPQ
ncbi:MULTISPECIES: phosphodiester glycosidase family protein [Rhodanobacter]|uniref:Phosphodiester glycosidase family protein n=1 Tax=Rhodanobacter hydrolyticus TaxID=2250595 RepID=A0ABW8J9S2_9GAMM|nr:phosphodiester glycosidase family protein [Rhodanobacter sp. 7MK24]MBD8880490.1 phosphodiester glycosidase family protein [Rhodanobacter sp. 7MK24]